MGIACQIFDRPDGDARCREVHQELGEPRMLIVRVKIRAEKRNHVMRIMRVRRPEFGPVHDPATVSLLCFGAGRGEVGPAVRLAHANTKEEFPFCRLRQDHLALFFGAKAQQQLPALPVPDPMRANRRSSGKHFFQHYVALQSAAFMPAIFFRPGHADPTFGTELFGEFRVVAAPGLCADHRGNVCQSIA